MLAMELIPAIRARLARLDGDRKSALASGRRAALWRAQQQAARISNSLEDVRRFCLESLSRHSVLEAEHENDYLRGYREGLQAVLNEIRAIETRGRRV
jgi:hypothetical protein